MSATRPSTDRPRVVLIAHEVHQHGGMERVTLELLRRTADDFQYTVLARELDPSLMGLVDHVHVRVPARPFALKYVAFAIVAGWRLRTLPGLRHSIGALVPNAVDLVTVHYLHAAAPARPQASGGGLGRLRRANTQLTRALSLLAEHWCYRPARVRHLAAVSGGVADECRSYFPGVAVSVTPNGVDAGRFKPDATIRRQLRGEFGVAEVPVALFVGGDWGRKGLDLAVDALAHVPGLELWVIGRGDSTPLRRRADQAGTLQRLRFLGERTDPERFMAAADIFVLPSSYETFSLVAHEAAASGLPVVATPVHGVRELVGRDACGFLVPAEVTAIADALGLLADDASLRERMGRAARGAALGFDWEHSAARVTSLQQGLLA